MVIRLLLLSPVVLGTKSLHPSSLDSAQTALRLLLEMAGLVMTVASAPKALHIQDQVLRNYQDCRLVSRSIFMATNTAASMSIQMDLCHLEPHPLVMTYLLT